MKKLCYTLVYSILTFCFFSSCKENSVNIIADEENEGYDGAWERGLFETQQIQDPALGYVPVERLWTAIQHTENLKQQNNYRLLSMLWTERGPVYDSVGPSNGNTRAGNGYTSGRMRAFLVDESDPTGNTVFAGGIQGGLWKCTNFLDNIPEWQNIDDYFDNMGISFICQSPFDPNTMYFSTGEPVANADAVLGKGVWKSTDHGISWTWLSSSSSYTRIFKVLCDNSGNIYLALRSAGLKRSTDGGVSWDDITPSGVFASCTDIEISSTGRLHASFGYNTGTGIAAANYRYTDIPATVNSSSGWNTGVGLPTAVNTGNRIELDCEGNILYAVPTNNSNNAYGCWVSTDGGENWRKKNVPNYTSSLSNTQGWYGLAVKINPTNTAQVLIGGLDTYYSTDSGANISILTHWVAFAPYVHADHHLTKWWTIGAESRILIATDGGLFLSRDNGVTFLDKNRNLRLKQFYSCAIHPTLTNYLLAGAQDNGCHQIQNAGLTYSTEVTGGDGAFVAIDQDQPQYQFTSYTFNRYRRSNNGGLTWTNFDLSSSAGLFINPFEYDDATNIMYCSNGNNAIRRWNNPQTAVNVPSCSQTILTLSALTGSASALKISSKTPNRIFVGSSSGKLLRLNNADTVSAAYVTANLTNITGPSFTGYINCIEIGTSDNYLLAVFSNYGVTNLWFSSDGGTNWTAIDGDLPDMPVRWAVFYPEDNTKALIATEAGVYTTNLINGASTQWSPSPGFPLVRTNMLKIRKSDNIVVAATHGRGLFSASILTLLPIKNVKLQGSILEDGRSLLKWSTIDETSQTRYVLQYSTDGITFTSIANLPYNMKQFRHEMTSRLGYYRVMAFETGEAPVFSNTVMIKMNRPIKGLQVSILPNPVSLSSRFFISSSNGGNYTWQIMNNNGQIILSGKGNFSNNGGNQFYPIPAESLVPGIYRLRVMQNNSVTINSFVKQ